MVKLVTYCSAELAPAAGSVNAGLVGGAEVVATPFVAVAVGVIKVRQVDTVPEGAVAMNIIAGGFVAAKHDAIASIVVESAAINVARVGKEFKKDSEVVVRRGDVVVMDVGGAELLEPGDSIARRYDVVELDALASFDEQSLLLRCTSLAAIVIPEPVQSAARKY